jgi:hypothetical protein
MYSKRLIGGLAAVAALGVTAYAAPAQAATIRVTSTANGGADTLRQAIQTANNQAGEDTIRFDFAGGGPHVIALANNLPAITQPVRIDGYTEPDAVEATAGTPAEPSVVIDATVASTGLRLFANESVIRGLAIHSATNNAGDGIRVEGNRNHIEGNFLGTDETGASATLGNAGEGVHVIGEANVVGGTAPEHRNVIAANGGDGVLLDGQGNVVEGNAIGTDPTMTLDRGNGNGVRITGGGNRVGGTAAGARNVITGDISVTQTHVWVESGPGNVIEGNLIGTDGTGNAGVTGGLSSEFGVVLESAGNVVGGAAPGAGNVIALAGGGGVSLLGSANTVQGNKIGTNLTGDASLENLDGIEVAGDYNTIGGSGEYEANLISGNVGQGVEVEPDSLDPQDPPVGNRIEGNLIGTDVNGVLPLGNGSDGVEIVDGSGNWVGGLEPDEGNVIADNQGDGVRISIDDRPGADGNHVVGNAIGTDASGTLDLGNLVSGVDIDLGDKNIVGDPDPAVPVNTIAFNDADGVTVDGGTENGVVGNSMFENGDLGIDLDDNGVTLNDLQDPDVGPNDLQNTPEIASATSAAGVTTVDWTLNSLPSTSFRLDFYVDDACGQGRSHLGHVNVSTDGAGDAAGSVELPATDVGDFVVATAGVRQPPVSHTTSELSPCVEVT